MSGWVLGHWLVIWNGILFKISFFNDIFNRQHLHSLLFLYRDIVDSYIPILHPMTLLNQLTNSKSLTHRFLWIFYICHLQIMVALFLSFQSLCFYFFPSLFTQASTSSTTLNRRDDGDILAWVLVLKISFRILPLSGMFALDILVIFLIKLRKFLSLPKLRTVFS